MASADPDDVVVVSPITKLLADRMADKGWQLRDVVRPPDGTRVGGPARSTMSHYLQGVWLRTMPRPKAIEELAVAMRLDEQVIKDAAYRSLESNRGNVPESVGGADDDEDVWRYQRPPGISDQEWERLQAAAKPILDALVAQYGDAGGDVRPRERRG